jgi:hypothetical protein
MRRSILLWLIPVCFTFHNLEEALTIPRFLAALLARLPASIQKIVPVVNYSQYLIALMIVTILPYLFILAYQFSHKKRLPLYLLLGTQMVVFINVFSHVSMAVLLRGYAPGVVTALLVNLPFSIYLFHRALREAWINRHDLVMLVLVGLLLHGPGLWALLRASAWIVGAM